MQQEETKEMMSIYTAYQNKQHQICYHLETSNSMRILRSIKKGTSIANVCEDNLQNLDKFIDRLGVDNYVKEIQNQKQIRPPSIQQLINNLQMRISQLQNFAQREQEQNQSDSSDDWQPDEEDEEEEDNPSQQQ